MRSRESTRSGRPDGTLTSDASWIHRSADGDWHFDCKERFRSDPALRDSLPFSDLVT